jgi:hypothetical protein
VRVDGGHRDRITGKLQTIMEATEHGQHIFRAYWKRAWVKQYEKYSTFLRNDVTSNNLRDFKLHQGPAYLGQVRTCLRGVLVRFAAHQAENLNVHEDVALLRRIALPVECGTVRTPGIRIQDPRMIRLLEVLLHAGTAVGGWSARHIHAVLLDRFALTAQGYSLNSLRYDLSEIKEHGLLEREAGRYANRLTTKGQRVAILFLLFHQHLCGPLAGSHFLHRPDQQHYPKPSQLERTILRIEPSTTS